MELHERLATGRIDEEEHRRDPFAELKNRVHREVIAELGPQLFDRGANEVALRADVAVAIRSRLAEEPGISRAERERLEGEVADDILGYGPLERLLADETVTEVMVNGAYDIWIERDGLLAPHRPPLRRRLPPAPDRQQDRRPGRPADRRVVADGRRAPARREPRQRDRSRRSRSAARCSRSGSSRTGASTSTTSSRSGRSPPRRASSSSAASAPGSTSSSPAAPAPARRRC